MCVCVYGYGENEKETRDFYLGEMLVELGSLGKYWEEERELELGGSLIDYVLWKQ